MNINILIADNHGILRQGIASLIEQQGDMKVVGQAENGIQALELSRQLRPNLIIMAVTMPILNGMEATRQIKKEMPEIKVLALSAHAKREFVLGMIKAGVSGYMVKECVLDDLVRAIEAVMNDQSYLSPQIASIVLNDITKDGFFDISRKWNEPLTPRERQILQLLTEGFPAKQIASQLGLSVKTIEANRRQIMEKTDVDNLVDLTKYAIRQGLTTV